MLALSRRSALFALAMVGLTACGSAQNTTSDQSSVSGSSASSSVSASASSPSSEDVSKAETGVRTESGYHLNTVVEGAPTVTLYTDLQCPYCAKADPTYRKVAELLEGTMNVTVRHFPLPKHTNATPAAQAVQAAEKQGAYVAMSQHIFTHMDEWKGVKDSKKLSDLFTGYARDLNLDTDRFVADLSNEEDLKLIQDEFEAGKKAGVPGTPTFVVEGTPVESVDSSASAEDMAAAFKKQADL